jgi:hypothetical protein
VPNHNVANTVVELTKNVIFICLYKHLSFDFISTTLLPPSLVIVSILPRGLASLACTHLKRSEITRSHTHLPTTETWRRQAQGVRGERATRKMSGSSCYVQSSLHCGGGRDRVNVWTRRTMSPNERGAYVRKSLASIVGTERPLGPANENTKPIHTTLKSSRLYQRALCVRPELRRAA